MYKWRFSHDLGFNNRDLMIVQASWYFQYELIYKDDYKENLYSRTSRKRPPKMSSGGGRLRKVVAYESLHHNGSTFFLIRIW